MTSPFRFMIVTALAAMALTGCTPTPAIFLRGEESGEVTIIIGACGTAPRVTEIIVDSIPKGQGGSQELWRVVSESNGAQPIREFSLGSPPPGFSEKRDVLGRFDNTRASLGITYYGPDDDGSWAFGALPAPGVLIGPEGDLENETEMQDFGC